MAKRKTVHFESEKDCEKIEKGDPNAPLGSFERTHLNFWMDRKDKSQTWSISSNLNRNILTSNLRFNPGNEFRGNDTLNVVLVLYAKLLIQHY